jgi:hypothetical protein
LSSFFASISQFPYIKYCLYYVVDLLSQMTFLNMALDPGSSSMNLLRFSLPSEDFLQKVINVPEEDVFYNWTDMSSMSMSRI